MKRWFGPNSIGWGMSPRSWQGWLLAAIYIGFVLFVINFSDLTSLSKGRAIKLATMALVLIMFFKYKRR